MQQQNGSNHSANSSGKNKDGKGNEKTFSILPKTLKIFQLIINVEHSLGEFRKLLLPTFIAVLDNNEVCVETRRATLCFLMHLANDIELHQFAPRIVHPLMRLLTLKNQTIIQPAVVTALSCLVCRLGANYAPYVIPVRRQMKLMINKDG